MVIENGVGNQARFSFASFQFVGQVGKKFNKIFLAEKLLKKRMKLKLSILRIPANLFMGIVKFTFVIQMLRLAHHHATEAENGELLIYTLKTYAA